MMLPPFRSIALAVLSACAVLFGSTAHAVDDPLPPEPAGGEWLEDTLDDDGLWFASSGNLAFEAVASALTDHPRGRRWVRVIDGRLAWVMYYVPGEILGFEVDTHHFGAAATNFAFAVGTTWNDLHAVDADYEEITGFEATWMRLYRTVAELPPGIKFLRITFPEHDDEVEAARLTEVWLRCRFNLPAFLTGTEATYPPNANDDASTAVASLQTAIPDDANAVAPYVVQAFRVDAPALPALQPIFTPTPALPLTSELNLPALGSGTRVDLETDFAFTPEPLPVPERRRGFLSAVAAFLFRSTAQGE